MKTKFNMTAKPVALAKAVTRPTVEKKTTSTDYKITTGFFGLLL
jgi:hypothetical protein